MCFEKPPLWWLLETHVAFRRSWEEPSRQGSSLHRLISAKRMRVVGGASRTSLVAQYFLCIFFGTGGAAPYLVRGAPYLWW